MRGLQLVRPGSLAKKSSIITSAARSASCSRGWLRLLVQSIFAVVTVASFVLILIMAIPKWPSSKPLDRESRCTANSCRVVCREAPYFGEYEDDIIHGMTDVDSSCKSVSLTLNKPMFFDGRMPPQWLERLRTNIHELTIMDGNLRHVPCDAFMSQYSASIRVLEFTNLELRSWTSNSLVGLSSLQTLYIRNSTIRNVPRDALRPVNDTLQSLTITRSNHWDPTNVTGQYREEVVKVVHLVIFLLCSLRKISSQNGVYDITSIMMCHLLPIPRNSLLIHGFLAMTVCTILSKLITSESTRL
ncbi:hypothetical protein PYW08_003990 [Mythimna loreyi]|uniref:Uncharacterized protein n=1 Tax=Mythimna loreyi TaxID=667449 RepID=A0ACC2QUH7_9NEOP|nr:hypothetical protein PYW08_003990 [Mythimna loreyi]